MSKSVENIFDTFWRFLTFFDVAPFRWPLLRSADKTLLKQARSKTAIDAAILDRVLDRDWTLNRRGPQSTKGLARQHAF